ncbi:hypothetical protein N7507_004274 [Penicillium longicatenatum]|nr:hypothetical protein N7507_004274 [Penicillium longicatenatum]
MPHRDLLATILPYSIGLRYKDGKRALEALESLYSEAETVLYHDSLRPLGDVYLCGKSMKEFKDHRKWLHLYRCHIKHYRASEGFAEMCFECDLWFTNSSEWDTTASSI